MEEKKSIKGPCRLSVPMDEEPELQAHVQQKIQELGDSCVVEQGRVMNTVQWAEGMDIDDAQTLAEGGTDPRVTRQRFATFRIPAPPSSYKGSCSFSFFFFLSGPCASLSWRLSLQRRKSLSLPFQSPLSSA